MDMSIKILLTTELEGGTTKRTGVKRKIYYGDKGVTKGYVEHEDKETVPATLKTNITKFAYNHFISDDSGAEVHIGRSDWMLMNEKQRMEVHLLAISRSLGGLSFSYELLED